MLEMLIPAVACLTFTLDRGSQSPCATSCCAGEPAASDVASDERQDSSYNRVMDVELLALDLETCDRCTGTDAAIEAAVQDLQPVLASVGVRLRFRKTIVQSAEQATELRFRSSPTVRINGSDLPIELRESRCGDCTTLCGGTAATDCRVWIWRGREYTEAPKGLITDAVLRAYSTAGAAEDAAPPEFVLPDNLRRFFDAKRERPAEASGTTSPSAAECCDTKNCCAGSEKATCCGSNPPTGKKDCGCKPR